MSEKKRKKEKVVYIDDGRTIADMSNVTGAGRLQLPGRSAYRPAPRVRDVLRTYFSAVRMMFLPMLVVIGFIAAAFLIVSLIFWLL
ncbi:MAG: hypothetical protein E7660_04860 [Ruminococcaceae bacterium]|nr:hypothetical protein [Oscillospiraceae bacterium]